jgi:hypothetical protein
MKLFAMKIRLVTCVVLSLALSALHVSAQTVSPSSITFDNNKVQAKLILTPSIEVDVTLEFENSIGLNANTLDITAELVSPVDLAVTNRLPSTQTTAVSGFPVIVSVTPKPDAGFGFEGPAMIEVYTKAIHYDPAIPMRLFTSHAGGTFEDITTLTSSGSYRARGNTGRFSDFIILLDNRDDSVVMNDKLQKLTNIVSENQNALSPVIYSLIDTSITNISRAVSVADYSTALVMVDRAISLVESADDADIPNVWRSSGDIANVQGELLSGLKTLRYSLRVN